jgi:hypothetical protein
MSVALIGLVGVIAGALIGGWTNSWIEERKRLHDARGAKRLIAAEFEDAAICAETAIEEGRWPEGLSDKEWQEGRGALLAAMDKAAVNKLTTAHGVVSDWIKESQEEHAEPPDETATASYRRNVKFLREISKGLANGELKTERVARRRRRTYTTIGAVIGLAIVVVLAMAAFVPRPHLTDQTIASALQSKLGHGALVACREGEDDWLCKATFEPPPHPTCGSQAAMRARRPRSETVALVATPRCSKIAPPAKSFVVEEGADAPVAMQKLGLHLRTADRRREMLELTEAKESKAKSFWERLLGQK